MLELCTGKAKTLVAHVKLCVEDTDEHISQYPHAMHRKGWQPLKTKHTHMVCPPCDNWSTVRWGEEEEEEEEEKEEEKERKLPLTTIKYLYMCNGVTHLVNILIRCVFLPMTKPIFGRLLSQQCTAVQ